MRLIMNTCWITHILSVTNTHVFSLLFPAIHQFYKMIGNYYYQIYDADAQKDFFIKFSYAQCVCVCVCVVIPICLQIWICALLGLMCNEYFLIPTFPTSHTMLNPFHSCVSMPYHIFGCFTSAHFSFPHPLSSPSTPHYTTPPSIPSTNAILFNTLISFTLTDPTLTHALSLSRQGGGPSLPHSHFSPPHYGASGNWQS